MLKNDGIPSKEELAEIVPSSKRMEKGPVAIIECFQDIPCDPCVAACPSHAIQMKEGITDKPHINFDKCTGCRLCVAKCPGLAIFVVDMTHSPKKAALSLPYELLPVPKKGDTVQALDRTGKPIVESKVLTVIGGKNFDKTYIITIEVPKGEVMEIRAIKVGKVEKS